MRKGSNRYNNPFFNNIDTNTYVNEIILFIEQKLNLFPDYLKNSSILQNLPNTIEGENKITENLCVFFNTHEKKYTYTFEKQDNYEFQFSNQSTGKGHRTYDTGVILANTKGNLGKIVVMEAKRLPTPGSKREKEYVEGNLGGIERFKKEVHSQEISNNLAIMIGYIQGENSSHWYAKVNEWINEQLQQSTNPDISWFEEDKLKIDLNFICENEKITKYLSAHSRITLDKINLNHYWMILN
ncbi:hypothetical protein GOQ30_15590 [Flavobacterium sp. TP390]|uniref:Restriction endonuclease n=1 Tax=Flavobacterium profundi TaxID=1774945 RepID=A0A6I4IUQ5_9FLAO|nr:hypothetical protein [Flavobacterium profundi]MVO10596.1 hypothetical protein [Flavobacterium profundi]